MGGFVTTTGGLTIMHNRCGTPRGVNRNDKTVMINPPGRTTTGGAIENLTPGAPSTLRTKSSQFHTKLWKVWQNRVLAPLP